MDLEILQEDNEILVCLKPAGIPVQTAGIGKQDMVSLLKKYRVQKGEAAEIYVVHRLDQPVEGVMVFAKSQKAASILSKQIQQKMVDKCYYALVEGVPNPAQGTCEDYLLRDGKTNTSAVVKEGVKGAKRAILHYKVLETKGEQSMVEIQLETGRHHQIRVQMAHAGHPLVGDKKYNPNCQSAYMPIGLCSVGLTFLHPVTKKKMEFFKEPKGSAFCSFEET